MRADLASLNADALAQLANAGLVKRAQRELASGYAPALDLQPDGTLAGAFPDGVRTAFPPGKGLRDASCTCGAAGACRHRIALVLAYQAQAGAVVPQRASPGTIDEATLRAAVPAAVLLAADRLAARHLVADVERAAGAESIPTVRLPMATVRFLAGADFAFARCDCIDVERCVHVVLAVLAFRRADAQAPDAPSVRVELGERAAPAAAEWPHVRAALASLLVHGLEPGPAHHAQALTRALEEARARRATYIELAVEAVEDWLVGHVERSARWAGAHGLTLVAELEARLRAAAAQGALSAKEVLGLDEPHESALGRTRLASLGCRIHEEADRHVARVALLDPDTGTKLLLRHAWPRGAGVPAPDPRQVRVGRALRLADLAQGHVVGTTLARRANGEVRIGATHAGRFSLTPSTGDWSTLPQGAVVRDLDARLAARRARAPALLRVPDGLADFELIAVAEVDALAYDPVEQSVHATCIDPAGNAFVVAATHAATTPHALDALYRALAGGWGQVQYVAGVLRTDGLPVLEPWSVTTAQRFVVPDCATEPLGLADAPIATQPIATDAVLERLEPLASLLETLLHQGATRVSGDWIERARASARALAEAGADRMGAALAAVVDAVREVRAGAAAGTLVAPVASLVIRLELAREIGT